MRASGATAIGRTKNAAPDSRLRRSARFRASSGIRQACSAMAQRHFFRLPPPTALLFDVLVDQADARHSIDSRRR